MNLKRFSNGTEFERRYGYCRAVRVGDFIFVSGTTALPGDLSGDTAAQFLSAVGRIEEARNALGARLEDVVRTVIYARNVADIDAIAQAHFASLQCASARQHHRGGLGAHPDEARVEVELTAVAPA